MEHGGSAAQRGREREERWTSTRSSPRLHWRGRQGQWWPDGDPMVLGRRRPERRRPGRCGRLERPRTDSVRQREEVDGAELVAVPAGSGVAGIVGAVRRPEADLAAAGRIRVRVPREGREPGEERGMRGAPLTTQGGHGAGRQQGVDTATAAWRHSETPVGTGRWRFLKNPLADFLYLQKGLAAV